MLEVETMFGEEILSFNFGKTVRKKIVRSGDNVWRRNIVSKLWKNCEEETLFLFNGDKSYIRMRINSFHLYRYYREK